MCGRFTIRTAPRVKLPGVRTDLLFQARYNVAPTQDVFVVADFGNGPELTKLSWGLIPAHSADGKRFINARGETIEIKQSFSESFRRRRCLILADGFFEWQRSGKSKRPYYFQMSDESQFAFAGIWDSWGAKERITACAIVTTAANEALKPIHNRMPVILTPESYQSWLDSQTDPRALRELLSPFPAAAMSSHPVSRAVNSVENDGPELVDRNDYEVGTNFSLFDNLN
jgi:putative SOS response-associated peptidase YedK